MDDTSALRRVSVGILTWHRPYTLRHSLASYRSAGLLDAVGETILFANASHPDEMKLAHRYGLRLITARDNIGIGPAFARLAEAAASPYFLFLENDWPCIEPGAVARARLVQGVKLLETGTADVVRYRHRTKYGHPLYSRQRCEGRETEAGNQAYLLDAVHWRTTPEVAFAGVITRQSIDGADWFFAGARNASYTNNPSLYRTAFARDAIGPRGEVPGVGSETALQDWWQTQPLTVAQGAGIFTHRDPGKEWRRLKATLRTWLFGKR